MLVGSSQVTRYVASAAWLAALSLGAVGCGESEEASHVDPPVAVDTAGPADLTCPGTGETVSMSADPAEMPDGFDTREEAIERWLTDRTEFGNRYLIAADGTGAWLLRPDDTAFAKVEFIEHHGFTANNYTACAD